MQTLIIIFIILVVYHDLFSVSLDITLTDHFFFLILEYLPYGKGNNLI